MLTIKWFPDSKRNTRITLSTEETFSLLDVQEIRFLVNGNSVDLENPPLKGRKIELEFLLTTPKSILVPFTEVPLAAEWGKFLHRTLKHLQSGNSDLIWT